MSIRRFGFLRPPLLLAKRILRGAGFELTYSHVSGIPDSQLYWPMFQPWRSDHTAKRLHLDDNRSVLTAEARYYFRWFAEFSSQAHGSIAECGVYRGGTAKLLIEVFPDRELLLFDTFAGMPETDASKDLHRAGDFSDTSIESVRAYIGDRPTLVPGMIPQTLESFADRKFAFVHIDLDIYSAILPACEFFYPRMSKGGIMLFDDYGFASCPGARAAVDEFLSTRDADILCLTTGQAVLFMNDL